MIPKTAATCPAVIICLTSNKKSLQEFDESWNAALFQPAHGLQEKWQGALIVGGDVSGVKFEHLGKNLKDVWNAFCGSE